ncbi:MAG: penicillin-binding protein 2 [Dysgonamonadaceae bacterium]|jgi:penicillin-binding protein 2|nr:penicillin-binding protein 2 [Dysgonamonadaceae bacterium]
MKRDLLESEKRKMYIIGFVCLLGFIYLIQLFKLQVVDDEYKQWADNNAFLNKTLYPSRGAIYDRNGKLLVYNQSAYDVTVVMRETGDLDTTAFCKAVNIDIEKLRKQFADVKNRKLNPGYSQYTPQIFLTQLDDRQFGKLQESLYKFSGFDILNRTIRKYNYENAAHVLGYIAQVDKKNMEADNYYSRGDNIGKTGVEQYYESELRGTKGVEVLLRDVHGIIKGKYQDGIHDVEPVPGKDLTLSLDIDLQAYGESLMQNKLGSIVMIEPSTGEILCMVSAPTYDPSILVGRQFSDNYTGLKNDPYTPLINRAINGTYPPGSTFKPAQALVFLHEGIIQPSTAYSCYSGFPLGGGKPACHLHNSPLALAPALATSCNSYFCWGLKAMLDNKKYSSNQEALDKWRDDMVAQGFGYPLGIDLPGEKRGMIPNSGFYDKRYSRWNPFTVISIAIGQGEIETTPLQLCNYAATISNRGYFITPHIVKKIKDTPLDRKYTDKRSTNLGIDNYAAVVEGMRLAVTGGTCYRASIPGIEVCGKTGTVQNKGKNHSLFIGFAPKDNPKVAVAVIVENAGYGAEYGVPIGRLMIEKYLNGEISEQSRYLEENITKTSILRHAVPKN